MSSIGFPDGQRITQWLGSPLASATALAIGAGNHVDGPFNLASWASVIVAVKATGGTVTVTVTQTINGGPPGLALAQQFVVPAGQTLFESVVLFGDTVTLTLQGSAPGETVDYALYPANTTTNAQVLATASLNFQHNEVLVAAEAALDFVDVGASVFTVTDDPTNGRIKVSMPRSITAWVSDTGAILAGSGFTVTVLGVGLYRVNFSVAFAGTPCVNALVADTLGAAEDGISLTGVGAGQATVELFNTNTRVPVNQGFFMHALQMI